MQIFMFKFFLNFSHSGEKEAPGASIEFELSGFDLLI
jgi:hypothetical protein